MGVLIIVLFLGCCGVFLGFGECYILMFWEDFVGFWVGEELGRVMSV